MTFPNWQSAHSSDDGVVTSLPEQKGSFLKQNEKAIEA